MSKTLMTAAALAAALVSTSVLAGGDYAAGEKKAKEVCAACHGVDGNSPSNMFPRIAGQWESYIIASLKQYKDGQRKNAVMAPQAQALSDEDIQNVATYFSQQKPALFVLPRD